MWELYDIGKFLLGNQVLGSELRVEPVFKRSCHAVVQCVCLLAKKGFGVSSCVCERSAQVRQPKKPCRQHGVHLNIMIFVISSI